MKTFEQFLAEVGNPNRKTDFSSSERERFLRSPESSQVKSPPRMRARQDAEQEKQKAEDAARRGQPIPQGTPVERAKAEIARQLAAQEAEAQKVNSEKTAQEAASKQAAANRDALAQARARMTELKATPEYQETHSKLTKARRKSQNRNKPK